jgi:hypothetical protein
VEPLTTCKLDVQTQSFGCVWMRCPDAHYHSTHADQYCSMLLLLYTLLAQVELLGQSLLHGKPNHRLANGRFLFWEAPFVLSVHKQALSLVWLGCSSTLN